MWHQKFSDNLQNIGFIQFKVDYDLWMRDCKDHYEYIAVMVDDIFFIGNDSESIFGPIRSIYCYKLKGVGSPEYYSGADIANAKKKTILENKHQDIHQEYLQQN